MKPINRREFLRYGARTTAALGVGGHILGSPLARALAQGPCNPALPPPGCAVPDPAASGIEHVVLVMMENRSFDHFLGWLPNADGRQGGLTYIDQNGSPQSTYPLVDYVGCCIDPNHGYDGLRIDYDGGAMDGFLFAGSGNDRFTIGYYEESYLGFIGALARQYTTCDRYFSSILTQTFPNRMFAHAATTDRLDNGTQPTSVPTIWDRLADAGRTGFYYRDGSADFLALWQGRYNAISRSYDNFLHDAANVLPDVSFIDPEYLVHDDHPFMDIRDGDAWVNQTVSAILNGPNASSTVIIITFDEGGGFFEHVSPPRVDPPYLNDPTYVDTDKVNDKVLLGFRVPTIIVSPWTRGDPANPRISSLTFDHTSVLKLIEWRWGLCPLTARDASPDLQNLVCALSFA